METYSYQAQLERLQKAVGHLEMAAFALGACSRYEKRLLGDEGEYEALCEKFYKVENLVTDFKDAVAELALQEQGK